MRRRSRSRSTPRLAVVVGLCVAISSVACGLSIIGGLGGDDDGPATPPTNATSSGSALPDGSVLLGDGAVLLPDGNVIPLPDGATIPDANGNSDAVVTNPNPCGANLATDPLNCGRCAHSCLGGACVTGQCAPILLAGNEDSACAIAVNATTVYFAQVNSGKIRKIPIGGGTATDHHPTAQAPHDLVLDVDLLYWGDQGKVGWVALSGGATKASPGAGMYGARAIAKTTAGVYSLAEDNVNYFKRGDLTQLSGSIGVSGGQASIATTSTHVYWVSAGAVHRATLGATQPEAGSVLNVNATSLAIDATHIYWTAGAIVARAKLTDFIAEPPISNGETNARAIAVDASGVYWADFTTNTIRFRSSSGGAPVTLAANVTQIGVPPLPRVIALDATAVYFVSSLGDSVSKVAKP